VEGCACVRAQKNTLVMRALLKKSALGRPDISYLTGSDVTQTLVHLSNILTKYFPCPIVQWIGQSRVIHLE
jgi:hypothetical protein